MVLTDDLKNDMVGVIQTEVDNSFTHGAIGTSDAAEDETDSTLGNEVLRKARSQFVSTTPSNGSGDATASLFVNSTEANGNTIQEVGFFDASSGGEMQERDVHNDVSKTNEFELYYDVQVSIEVVQV